MTVIILFKAPWIFSWFKPGTGTILCSCSYYSFLLCALISLSYYTLISCNLQLWLGEFLAVTFSNVLGMLIKCFKSSSQSLKEPLFLVFPSGGQYKCNKNYHCITLMQEDTFFSIWTKTIWGFLNSFCWSNHHAKGISSYLVANLQLPYAWHHLWFHDASWNSSKSL